ARALGGAYRTRVASIAISKADNEEQHATTELPFFGYGAGNITLPFDRRDQPSPGFVAEMDASRAALASVPAHDGETVPLPTPHRAHDPTLAWNTKLLTIEQYAALCAELALRPERREQAYARQGIMSLEEGARVHKMFAIRFDVDADLRARWQTLTDAYAAWM